MRAAFFDLDKTVIAKSSLFAFGPEFHARGLLRRRAMIRAGLAQFWFARFGAGDRRLAKVRESVLRLTRGWDRLEIRQVVSESLARAIEPLIYAEALELIARHLDDGDEVYLVSSAPAEIVEPFAELLAMTGAISSRAIVDDEGKFTGELSFYAQGQHKAGAIERLARERDLDLAACVAYSDSLSDVPMLEVVGHPVAVNPDRHLAKIARERQWPTLTFRRRVAATNDAHGHGPLVVGALVVGTAAVLGARHRH